MIKIKKLCNKLTLIRGSMPEWLKGMDCKSISSTYAGSNPARPKKKQNNTNFIVH